MKGCRFIWDTAMVRELALKGNELLVYSIIQSYSQGKEQGCFYGSLETLAGLIGSSRQTAISVLRTLTEKGIIEKQEVFVNGVKRCAYIASEGSKEILHNQSKNLTGGSQNFLLGGSQKSLHNNKEYNIENIYKSNTNVLDRQNHKFDFLRSLIDMGVTEATARDWMAVRKNKKATNTETAFNAIVKEIAASGMHPDTAVQIAVVSEWRGIKAEWLKNYVAKNSEPQEKEDALQRLLRSEAEVERLREEGKL